MPSARLSFTALEEASARPFDRWRWQHSQQPMREVARRKIGHRNSGHRFLHFIPLPQVDGVIVASVLESSVAISAAAASTDLDGSRRTWEVLRGTTWHTSYSGCNKYLLPPRASSRTSAVISRLSASIPARVALKGIRYEKIRRQG